MLNFNSTLTSKIISLIAAVSFLLADISYAGVYQQGGLRVPVGQEVTRDRMKKAFDNIYFMEVYPFIREEKGVDYSHVESLASELHSLIKSRLQEGDLQADEKELVERELKDILLEGLKNAFESIQVRFLQETGGALYKNIPLDQRKRQSGDVEVSLKRENDNLLLEIKDDGAGVVHEVSKWTSRVDSLLKSQDDLLQGRWADDRSKLQSVVKRGHPEFFSGSGQAKGLQLISMYSHFPVLRGQWFLENRKDGYGAIFTYRFRLSSPGARFEREVGRQASDAVQALGMPDRAIGSSI